MQITLYNNTAEKNRVIKDSFLHTLMTIEGTLRESNSILTPNIVINCSASVPVFFVLSCNYLYIPDFKRYYFVVDKVVITDKLIELRCGVDVLMSFKSDIGELECLIDRNQYNSNKIIPDRDLPISPLLKVEETYIEREVNPVLSNFRSLDTMLLTEDSYNVVVTASLGSRPQTRIENIFPLFNSYYNQYKDIPSNTYLPEVNGVVMSPPQNDVHYVMTIKDLRKLLPLVYSNSPIASAIKSIIIYPYEIRTNPNVRLNGFSSDVGGYLAFGDCTTIDNDLYHNIQARFNDIRVPYNFTSEGYVYVEEFIITPRRGQQYNFLDFGEYCKYELYIPYVGYIEIDPKLYLTTSVNKGDDGDPYHPLVVSFSTNFNTGTAQVTLFSPLDKTIIYQGDAQVGINMGVNTSNMLEIERQQTANILNTMLGGIATGLGMNVIGYGSILAGATGFGTNPITQEMTYKSMAPSMGLVVSGITTMMGAAGRHAAQEEVLISKTDCKPSSPFGGLFLPNHIRIKYTYRYLYEDFNYVEFSRLHGNVLNKVMKIRDLYGFTTISLTHLSGFETATSGEIIEIEQALKSGVILPDPTT